MALLKLPYATKPIDNMFTAGESVMTAQYTPYGNVKICAVEKSPKSEIYAISNLFF